MLSVINGRVIVTGVGKSGHIGSKIAATLASTGTPAFFVHPSEANHGDLGMIASDDAIIAMSWSGESLELKGIVAYSRRFAIPLIAITAGEASALAREADVVLSLPRAPEACPHGLAPTTSTLLQLVDRRCAGGGAARGARLHARPFPHLPSRRPAWRQPDPCRRDHAQRRRDAGRRARHQNAGSDDDAVPRSVSAASASSTGQGGWSASSPTATSRAICTATMAELAVDDIMTRQPKTVEAADAGRRGHRACSTITTSAR